MTEVAEVLADMIDAVADKKIKLYGRSYLTKGVAGQKIENKA